MEQIKKTLLSTPIIGSAYLNWRLKKRATARTDHDYREWVQHPMAKVSTERLEAYRNKHRGQRCFIIGNGPSLKKMDLSPLKNEITFGANRIYLLFEELGFTTTYLCAINSNVTEQFKDDIVALSMPRFLAWKAHSYIPLQDNVVFLRSDEEEGFYPTPIKGLWEGATVTYVSLQLAYFMGFKTVYLIGVDHSFKDKGPAHKLVTAEAEDENHFHPDYFGKGVKWQLPDLDTSEQAYLYARQYYEANGRKVYDATVGGKLQIFPKVDYKALF